MSEEELIQARAEITSLFSSANIDFLRNRSKALTAPAKQDGGIDTATEPKKTKEASSDVESKLPITVDPNWVHMNVVEKDKLAWIGDLPEPSDEFSSAKGVRQYQVSNISHVHHSSEHRRSALTSTGS